MSIGSKLKSSLKFLACGLGIGLLATMPVSPAAAKDDSADIDYLYNVPQEVVDDAFILKNPDVSDPIGWLNEDSTFLLVQSNADGSYTLLPNVPTIPSLIKNSVYDKVAESGYGNVTPKDVSENSLIVQLDAYGSPKTAMDRLGFAIPSYPYIGERPLVTYDLLAHLYPDGFWDGARRVVHWVFTGEITDAPDKDDLASVAILAPRDYAQDDGQLERWIRSHWSEVRNLDGGQCLIDKFSVEEKDTCKYKGNDWVAQTILFDTGIASMDPSNPKAIVNKLGGLTQDKMTEVLTNISLSIGHEFKPTYLRQMPYDYERLHPTDKASLGGVMDPRAQIQHSFYNTGYDNVIKKTTSVIVSAIGVITEFSVALNNFVSFDALRNVGLDTRMLLNSGFLRMIFLMVAIALVGYTIVLAFRFFTGKAGSQGWHKLLVMVMFTVFAGAFTAAPVPIYNTVETVTTSWMGFVTTQSAPAAANLSSLYGTDASAKDKENTTIWLTYFNAWTEYNTNNSLIDGSAKINASSGQPEVKALTNRTIAGKTVDLWPALLAYEFTNTNNKGGVSGDVYRVVDHYMAPRLSISDNGSGGFNISASVNENYTGNIQSKVPIGSLVTSLLILYLVFTKLILFIELVVSMIMFVVDIVAGAISTRYFAENMKRFGAGFINVLLACIATGIAVQLSLVASSDLVQIILTCMISAAAFFYTKWVVTHETVFKPRILGYAAAMKDKVVQSSSNLMDKSDHLRQMRALGKRAREEDQGEEEAQDDKADEPQAEPRFKK